MQEKQDKIVNWILGSTSFCASFAVMLTAFAILGACTVRREWFRPPLTRETAILFTAAVFAAAFAALSVLLERKIRKAFGPIGSTSYFAVLIAAVGLFVRTQYVWILSLM